MKKFFIIIALIITSNAYSQWTVVSQVPSFSLINSISVVDQNVIWVACDTTHLFKTTNGGATWLSRSSGLPFGNLYGISALDTTNCWVGTVNGSIYRTSNGGMNWTLQFSMAGSFSDAIKMFDLNYGVYYGDPVGSGQPFQLRYTTNGGTNWLLSPNAPLSSNEYGLINSWDWLDTGRFWIGIANVVANATSSKVFRTTSGFGGGVWNATGIVGNGTSQGLYFQTVAFTDANNGMTGTNNSAIRKTTNGGVTWQTVSSPAGIPSFYCYNMNGLKDGSNTIRLCIGTTGLPFRIFRTTDLGTTWTEETLPSLGQTNGIHHMQFLNSSLGYSGGGAGTFMRYNGPSGVTNSNVTTPENFILEQNFPNPFNPNTIINYELKTAAFISIKVYDELGKEISSFVNRKQDAGKYSINFDAKELSSGLYFYTLETDNYKDVKKMVLLR